MTRTALGVMWLASGLLLGIQAPTAEAAVRDIEALFQPDPLNPQNNDFVNQTPSEGFCVQLPHACKPEGLFTLIAPIAFRSSGPIQAFHTDPRQGGMAKVPSEWRSVLVTHESGDTETLKIRIAAIGHESGVSTAVTELVGGEAGGNHWEAWNLLWGGGGWVNAPTPCIGVGTYTAGFHGYNSFWKVPVNAGVCAKQARFTIPQFIYQYFVYGYQLRTPKPLSMRAGNYRGTVSYTVGPAQDFDMGDLMIPNDNLLTLNFSLDVRHTLKVDIPPGGNRVELVPQGGWQGWLNQGRKPTRLFRDQTFNISASSRFKMGLECQYSAGGNTCHVNDSVSGHSVPVNISVSLPHGLTDAGGQPVNRRQLLRDGSGTELFQPGFYVDRKPGTLHFEISPSEVAEMIYPGQARQYNGSVTVIWDSDV